MEVNTSALIMNPGYTKLPARPSKELEEPTKSEARELRPEHIVKEETALNINEFLQATNTGIAGGGISHGPVFPQQPKTESSFPKKEAMILGGVLLVVIVGLVIYSHSKSKK